jgi:hypothetical protein
MAYRSIAAITASEARPSGIVFTIRTRDEAAKQFKLGLAINSSLPHAANIAQARMAEICRAIDQMMIVDTETMHGIDFIIEHDGRDILRFTPIKVTVEKLVPVGFWAWLLHRIREPE